MKFVFYFILIIYISAQAELKFIGENLTFVLENSRFSVAGTYFFYNDGKEPVKTQLYYPFVIDKDNYHPVDSIFVFNKQNGKRETLKQSVEGVFFPVECLPDSTVKYIIGYSQNLKGSQAEYILKTTSYWNAPLMFADYNLVADSSLVISEFPYPPDQQFAVSDKLCYSWHKENFMPTNNMLFKFKRK